MKLGEAVRKYEELGAKVNAAREVVALGLAEQKQLGVAVFDATRHLSTTGATSVKFDLSGGGQYAVNSDGHLERINQLPVVDADRDATPAE